MAANVWRFVWVDPATDTRFDIPCVDERKFSFKINAPGTAELVTPLRTELGKHIATGSGWGYVLIYRGSTLTSVHETVATDVGPKSSEGIPSIGITTTESAFAKAAAAVVNSTPFTIPSSALNAGLALGDLVLANPGWGIGEAALNGTNVTSINPSTFDRGMDLLTLINTLAFRGSGFVFRFNAPSSFTMNGGNTVVGNLNCFNLSGDNTLYDYRWEYGEGTKANLADYSWKRLGGEHLCNFALVPPVGDSEGNAEGVKVAVDGASIGVHGSRSRWITPDMPDGALRQQLANEHLLYRKAPRRVLTITPNMDDGSGRVPTPMQNYQPGAIMPVVIKDQGVTVVSGTVMVYAINITLDKDGKETVELETSQEGV